MLKSRRLITLLIGLLGLLTMAQERSYQVDMNYDTYGGLKDLTYSNGDVATHHYDSMGRVNQIQYDQGNGPETLIQVTEYTDSSALKSANYGAFGGATAGTRNYQYDALGRPISESLTIGGSVAYQASSHSYDHWGNLAGYERDDAAFAGTLRYRMSYTGQNQLASFSVLEPGQVDQPCGPGDLNCTQYSYDSRGNLTSRSSMTSGTMDIPAYSRTFKASNPFQPTDESFDNEGRLKDDGTYNYHYNSLGRLAMVTDNDGAVISSYLYDPAGTRVRKIANDKVTYYLRNAEGGVLISETVDADDTVLNAKNYVLEGQSQIAQISGLGEVVYSFNDRLGSAAVTWSAQGIEHHAYSPYGMQAGLGLTTIHEGLGGFQGHEDDRSTGLTYMRARYFGAEGARFMTVDPARDFDILKPASYNLYQFTHNNPISFVDPTGRAGKAAPGSKGYRVTVIGLNATVGANAFFHISTKASHSLMVFIDNATQVEYFYLVSTRDLTIGAEVFDLANGKGKDSRFGGYVFGIGGEVSSKGAAFSLADWIAAGYDAYTATADKLPEEGTAVVITEKGRLNKKVTYHSKNGVTEEEMDQGVYAGLTSNTMVEYTTRMEGYFWMLEHLLRMSHLNGDDPHETEDSEE